jgi:hypothetical protein
MIKQSQEQIKEHALGFEKLLVGKTIRSVSYLSDGDMTNMGWWKRPIIIQFTDGTHIIPQRDDEGNDGGALIHIAVNGDSKIIYTL